MKLTANFAAAEFDVHEAYPAQWATSKLPELAALCQWLRDLAGVPGLVTSAYRSPAHNDAVDGAEHSQHLAGEAADVVFALVPIRTLAARVLTSIDEGGAPAFGQVIFYADRGHVHVSLPTLGERNGEVRYSSGVNGDGTRSYPLLTDAAQLPYVSEAQAQQGFSSPAGSRSSCSSAGGSSNVRHAGGSRGQV